MGRLLENVSRVPGVTGVAVNSGAHPMVGWGMPVDTPGSPNPDTRVVLVNMCSGGYLAAMHIPLVRGRAFKEAEIVNAAHFALVNESFAAHYYTLDSVLGRMIRLPRLGSAPFTSKDTSFEVVGVVRDTLNDIESERIAPEVYIPYTVTGMPGWLIVTGPRAEALVNPVRAQVYAIDSEQPVTRERTLEQLLNEWVYSRPKFSLLLFGVFAAFGLVLALLGIYGVISQGVAQRTQEIGIRIALGAGFLDVMRMVLGQGAVLLGAGIASDWREVLRRLVSSLIRCFGCPPLIRCHLSEFQCSYLPQGWRPASGRPGGPPKWTRSWRCGTSEFWPSLLAECGDRVKSRRFPRGQVADQY